MAASSLRKTMSLGVRALWRNTTSASDPRSYIVRIIDMSGVMPLPADRKRYLSAGCRASVKAPSGAIAVTLLPGTTLSCTQLETVPPMTRLTVMAIRCGRVGGEEIV